MYHRKSWLVWIAAAMPAIAQAHVSVQTVELLAGTLHPWINPDSALVLVGLSLWLAQNAHASEIRPFVVLGFALTMGVASGLFLHVGASPWFVSVIALAMGLCVGLQWKPPPGVLLPGVACMAMAAGYYAGADAAPDIQSPTAFLAGALAGGLIFPLTLSALLPERRPRILQIGIRILGSWLAAIGLMLFALRLRG
jgi:urease accessory protein